MTSVSGCAVCLDFSLGLRRAFGGPRWGLSLWLLSVEVLVALSLSRLALPLSRVALLPLCGGVISDGDSVSDPELAVLLSTSLRGCSETLLLLSVVLRSVSVSDPDPV